MVDGALDGGANHSSSGRSNTKAFEETLARYRELSARALLELSVVRRLPIGNGILTVDTNAQAWTRARPEEADKGGDAVRAALSLVRLKRRLAMG